MATSRRAFSEDLLTDLAICVLEATARKPPVTYALLQEGKNHPHEQVQLTANRLLTLLPKD